MFQFFIFFLKILLKLSKNRNQSPNVPSNKTVCFFKCQLFDSFYFINQDLLTVMKQNITDYIIFITTRTYVP